MDKVLPHINETLDAKKAKGWEQFPVDIKVIRAVRFDTNTYRGDVLRVVVMNDLTADQYSAYHEYHFGNTEISIEDISSFTLRSCTIADTREAIAEFIGSMSTPLDIPQVVSFSCGIQSPIGDRKRLYKAMDPDDNQKMLGLLIEQDSQGVLTQVTWYKTWEASAAFCSTPETLEFEVVKDENGVPSIDPNDISGWTWYYSTTIGVGLSAQCTTV